MQTPAAFVLAFAAASAAAGAIASVSGFGIGSVLTPLLSIEIGAKAAVAVVSVPHFVATALRFWMLRRHLNRRVLATFGLMSAAGGLTGALLQSRFDGPGLSLVLGALLVFSGGAGLTGFARRLRFEGPWARLAGILSGVFGGLVGNQGGIRSAAMLGFDVPKEQFVATATAVALMVDGARMPVYLITERPALVSNWPLIAIGAGGAVVGTVAGKRVLEKIPEDLYRKTVSGLILALGAAMLIGGFHAR